jgi:assimilatory nitrate reductase catalytic subunit
MLGKFARVVLGTRNIDYNGRFCMAAAAVANQKVFGVDRGLPFPVSDIAEADVVFLVGANPAETMPPLMQYFARGTAPHGRTPGMPPSSRKSARRRDSPARVRP